MSKCLHRNHNFLKDRSKSKDKTLDALLKDASQDQIRALTEIAKNILSGNFKLKPNHFKKLEKHKKLIRKLSKKTPHKLKKKFLRQKGGFLPFLVTPVLSALGALAGRAIGSHFGL